MAKKVCEKKCKGIILDKIKGVYCSHIEKRMPKNSRQSVNARMVGYIDDLGVPSDSSPEERDKIEIRLRKFGLSPYEIELLMSRYGEGNPMSVVIEQQGWISVNSAAHYLRTALKKLRDGGFK